MVLAVTEKKDRRLIKSSKMIIFKILPHEICREIGSYLDYESRMNYNSLLDFEDKFVRKLNSDAHNLHVKVMHLSHYVENIYLKYDPIQKAIILMKLFHYLLFTKDTVLFTSSNMLLRTTLLNKLNEFVEYVTTDPTFSKKWKKNVAYVSTKLVAKFESISLDKKFNASFVKIK